MYYKPIINQIFTFFILRLQNWVSISHYNSCQSGLATLFGLVSAVLDNAAVQYCSSVNGGSGLITSLVSATLRPGQKELLPRIMYFQGPALDLITLWYSAYELCIWRQAQEQGHMPRWMLCSCFRVPGTSQFPIQKCLASRDKTVLLKIDMTPVCILMNWNDDQSLGVKPGLGHVTLGMGACL